MTGVLEHGSGKRGLIVVAAPTEGAAVLRGLGYIRPSPPEVAWTLIEAGPRMDLLVAGVGKGNAAGGVARMLDRTRHAWVLDMGIAGALPSVNGALAMGTCVLATRSVYADEGMPLTGGGFTDIAAMGFAPSLGLDGPPTMGVECDPLLRARLAPLADVEGVVATVSECSGTDERAVEIVRRTGAVAEAMEGAAAGFSVARAGGRSVAFAELRVISNTTGDRSAQVWDARRAFARLEAIVRLL